jgi:hypothetical protein
MARFKARLENVSAVQFILRFDAIAAKVSR